MRPRVLYFYLIVWCVLSGGRFTAPFLEEVAGFNDTLTGFALAMQTFLCSVLGSVGSTVADKIERRHPHRGRIWVMLGGIIVGTLAFMAHGLVALVVGSEDRKELALFCHMALRVIYSIGISSLGPVLDGVAISYLEEQGLESSEFGKERLYGAVAWAVASSVIGVFIDLFGFEIMFVFAPLGAFLCIFTCSLYIRDLPEATVERCELSNDMDESSTHDEVSISFTVESLPIDFQAEGIMPLENKDINWTLLTMMCGTIFGAGFMFSGFTLNMGTSVVENLIFLFFKTLGGSNTLCGLSVAVTVIFELPIFQLAPALLRYFGAGNMQQIACAAYIVRVIGYTFIPENHIALVLLLEPLHGVTYACAKTSGVEFAAQLTPKGFEASGQGVLGFLVGMGSVLGLCIGGWAEDTFGAKIMYRGFAAVVSVGLIVFAITDQIHSRDERKQTTSRVSSEVAFLKNDDTEKEQLNYKTLDVFTS